MSKIPGFIVATCTLLIMSACANTGAQYRPLIDERGVDLGRYNSDLSDCQVYAHRVAGAGQQAAVGAVAGALFGAVIAAAAGSGYNSGATTRVGAVTGAVAGAGSGETDQRNVIRNCMSGRGYRVLH